MIDEVRFGGPEKVAAEQVRALSELGHEAVLVVLRRTSSNAYSDLLSHADKIYFSDLQERKSSIDLQSGSR